jgi:hypothetical protein
VLTTHSSHPDTSTCIGIDNVSWYNVSVNEESKSESAIAFTRQVNNLSQMADTYPPDGGNCWTKCGKKANSVVYMLDISHQMTDPCRQDDRHLSPRWRTMMADHCRPDDGPLSPRWRTLVAQMKDHCRPDDGHLSPRLRTLIGQYSVRAHVKFVMEDVNMLTLVIVPVYQLSGKCIVERTIMPTFWAMSRCWHW